MELGLQIVELECDALQVVEALRIYGMDLSMYGTFGLIYDIWGALSHLQQWKINHVKLNDNEAVHRLAKEALFNEEHVLPEEIYLCMLRTVINWFIYINDMLHCLKIK